MLYIIQTLLLNKMLSKLGLQLCCFLVFHFDKKKKKHIKNEQEMSKIVLHLKIDSRINQYRRP